MGAFTPTDSRGKALTLQCGTMGAWAGSPPRSTTGSPRARSVSGARPHLCGPPGPYFASAGSGEDRSRREIAGLGLEPLADVTGAPLAVSRPSRREAIVDDVVALDAERVSNDPGRLVRVVAVDRLLRRSVMVRLPHACSRQWFFPGLSPNRWRTRDCISIYV